MGKFRWCVKRKMVWVRNHPVLSSLRFFIICTLLIIFVGSIFFWKRDWGWYSEGYVVDNAVWGNLGDFVGGLFGPMLTTITVLFMWWTITEQQILTKKTNRLQNKISKRQENMAEMQRFNDLFFSMLELYQTQVENLRYERIPANYSYSDPFHFPVHGPEVFTGKEFFSKLMEKMNNEMPCDDKFSRAKKTALRNYGSLYNRYSIEL